MALLVRLVFSVLAWGLALTASPPAALAQSGAQPVQDPILRIDPGMHTAVIRRVGVDTNCTIMATGSDDKTVRLWRLPEGRLLRVLRPPIGPGNDGKIFATTVSPDGTWVAAGGWDAAQKAQGGDYIYIFQVSTGTIITRIGPVTNVINHVTISPDGRFLAATLSSGAGIRIWERVGSDLTNWRLIGEDRDYNGQGSFHAVFDRTGALFTGADDGKVRRYAPGYRNKPTSVVTRGGKEPFSMAVHPSGDRLAVGFEDTTAVEIYDSATLNRRFAVDTKIVTHSNVFAVAWSPDGQRLFAGGRFTRGAISPIIMWDKAGQGVAKDIDGPRDTVMNLVSCSNGIAVGAADPALGFLSPDGRRRFWKEGVEADLRGQRGDKSIALSANARRVRFGLELYGDHPVLFDLDAERLTDAPSPLPDLSTADTTSLPVTDWVNDRSPKLGGAPITLEPFERARAVAVAPDRQQFILATEWALRSYNRSGSMQWRTQVPDVAWSINIPRDGKVAVAGYGDGTIRWHRLTDGKELLAMFVHKGDRRWVAWTPKGFYMASPGAEALIGWHVNRGWNDTAQFFPVDHFRDQFNRPDIVKLVLVTLDEQRAIDEANRRANVKPADLNVRASAPPTIVILNPPDKGNFSTPEVTIDYHAFSATGKRITDVDVRVNNSSIGTRSTAPITAGGGTGPSKLTVKLPPQDVVITLVARENNRASDPVVLHLRWDGARPGQVQLPRLRALFVGVNEYTAPDLPKLKFAAKDAKDLAAFFRKQEGKTYHKVEAKLLPDGKRADVLEGLEWLEKGSADNDVNLLFLAGHGITDEQQQFYYMAADSDPGRPRSSGISRNEILQTISNRRGAMVVMLDACHSADTAGTLRQGRVDMNKLINELGDKKLGVFLYASALGRQFSYEHPDWQNGAFTKAMIEGLSGMADREKLGYVETDELGVFVRRQVLRMTNGAQEPVRLNLSAASEMRIVILK